MGCQLAAQGHPLVVAASPPSSTRMRLGCPMPPHPTPPKPSFLCKVAVVAVNEMLLPYYSQDIALNLLFYSLG